MFQCWASIVQYEKLAQLNIKTLCIVNRPCSVYIALVRAGFGLFHLLLYFEELVLKYHDQDPYNNQLAAVQSQNKQACINVIKPGSVVYWEVTLFLNYIVRVWPLSLMLLNNLQWFSMTISNKVNATQWVCLKMEPLHTENRMARSKNPLASHFSVIRGCMLQCWGTFNFWFTTKKKKNQLCFRAMFT